MFGGKAAQLGAAVRAGLPVPPGIALSVELVAALAVGDSDASEVLGEVRAAVDGPLAVRSSCVGEDSAGASFAGQFETRLGVTTVDQLARAVQAVARSGDSAAAVAYRQRLGLHENPGMAVVVQRLVEADVAGVMFTRDPVTGADERLIEAARGLGEAVVQGLVIPDTYRVSRGGQVLERMRGSIDRSLSIRSDGSTSLEPVPHDLIGELCLSDPQLRLLHDLALRCEEVFDSPSDIEWALSDDVVHLLQCRPITGTRRAGERR